MQFFYKEKKVRNGYITAFGLLTFSYFIVFFIIHQMELRARLVSHVSEITKTLDTLLLCIKDSEITFRNYVILHDSTAPRSYSSGNLCIDRTFKSLNRLTSSDSFQKRNKDSLIANIRNQQSIINLTFEGIHSGNMPDEELLHHRVSQGTRIAEEIRTIVLRMQAYENNRLVKTNAFETTSKTLKIVHFTTFVLALMLVVYSMIVFNNVSKAKLHYRAQLEEGIEKLKIANNDLINLRSIERFAASGRIARSIAHEVRNPLTSISLAAEQLEAVIKSDDEKALLDIITRNVKRIHKLVVDLLNSTKFSYLKLSRHSLNTIADEALDLAKDRIELNSVKVVKNISPNPCYVEVDSEKIKIAILNILVNAIEAMEPEKGILEITTFRKDDKCLIIIKDNGIGMNEASLSRIFEPYFTQKEKGSGLGLTLTQNIILNHKGNISVESKPGRGTAFTLTLTEAGQRP